VDNPRFFLVRKLVMFGVHATLARNLRMGAVYTFVSVARSSILRRVFESILKRSL